MAAGQKIRLPARRGRRRTEGCSGFIFRRRRRRPASPSDETCDTAFSIVHRESWAVLRSVENGSFPEMRASVRRSRPAFACKGGVKASIIFIIMPLLRVGCLWHKKEIAVFLTVKNRGIHLPAKANCALWRRKKPSYEQTPAIGPQLWDSTHFKLPSAPPH
ncbi:MAG: hypothetical protein JWM59_910 [Verrucomicrobiales bacterium]|nr:hypothetical protein [Verrucomicrobiales bacterium]